ncbi:unnamed protein product [Leptidea sinapis]|uniref:Uncharacterized protein n=1 Tax=Leptidea sinapis TaxID=189913 RepID=A0A5E4QZZ2_9NEOP|nr:unnamed protein product [Leptidea sinapis]
MILSFQPAEKINNNFMKCLDNVRKIIGSLDRSLKKTRKYEDQLLYEELSKRYESLLRAYDDRSNVLSNRETALSKARELMKMKNKQLIEANTALLTVGEKYLNLRRKKFIQVMQMKLTLFK